MLRRLRFPLAVLGTSLLLVLGIGAAGALTLRSAFTAPFGPFGGPFGGGPFGGHALPPEFQGLDNLPPAERFAHFAGAQINLKDKDNKPVTVNIIPGKVTAVSPTSLTLAANDGTTKTLALDDKTIVRGKPDMSTPGNRPQAVTLNQGDLVVAITKNGEPTARFVMSGGTEGFSPRGGRGPWGGR